MAESVPDSYTSQSLNAGDSLSVKRDSVLGQVGFNHFNPHQSKISEQNNTPKSRGGLATTPLGQGKPISLNIETVIKPKAKLHECIKEAQMQQFVENLPVPQLHKTTTLLL